MSALKYLLWVYPVAARTLLVPKATNIPVTVCHASGITFAIADVVFEQTSIGIQLASAQKRL
jgi:hypothetical protein